MKKSGVSRVRNKMVLVLVIANAVLFLTSVVAKATNLMNLRSAVSAHHGAADRHKPLPALRKILPRRLLGEGSRNVPEMRHETLL